MHDTEVGRSLFLYLPRASTCGERKNVTGHQQKQEGRCRFSRRSKRPKCSSDPSDRTIGTYQDPSGIQVDSDLCCLTHQEVGSTCKIFKTDVHTRPNDASHMHNLGDGETSHRRVSFLSLASDRLLLGIEQVVVA